MQELHKDTERLHKEVEKSMEEFRAEMRRGVIATVGKLAGNVSRSMDGLLRKADPSRPDGGDTDVQKFLVDKFLKMVTPDTLVVGEHTPAQQMWQQISDYVVQTRGGSDVEGVRALRAESTEPTTE
jgi:hypothetical protein